MTDQPRPFRFVHCADLQLDRPFAGLHAVHPHIVPALRDAAFRALDNVIDLAVRERVDLILVAGGIFDGASRSLRAQIHFRDSLARAAGAGIPCCVVHGDDDPVSDWQVAPELPPESHRFGAEAVERFTIHRDGQPLVDVYGMSHATRDVTENLVRRFGRDGAAPVAIGLLHCGVGENSQQGDCAPCSLDDLNRASFDYWALGHVHRHTIVRDSAPTVAYPGSVQGRDPGESGPHGCLLVHVDQDARFHPEFRAVDTVRCFERSCDIGPCESVDHLRGVLGEIREQIRGEAEGRAAVVRLWLNGCGPMHSVLQRDEAVDQLVEQLRDGEPGRQDFVWVESLGLATHPPVDVAQRRQVEDFVGDFLRAAQATRDRGGGQAVRDLLQRNPAHATIATEIETLTNDDLSSILDEAEAMGLQQLLDEDRLS